RWRVRRAGGWRAAAVDEDRSVGGAERGQDPVTGAELGQRLDQGFLVVDEGPGDADVAIFRLDALQRCGGSVDPRVDAGDQVQLPGAALDLPDTQRREQQSPYQAESDEEPPLSAAPAHGV